jgi:hypothetical protein
MSPPSEYAPLVDARVVDRVDHGRCNVYGCRAHLEESNVLEITVGGGNGSTAVRCCREHAAQLAAAIMAGLRRMS